MNTRVGATRRAGRRLALLATAALMYPVTAAPNAPRAEIQVNLCGDPARIIERLQLKAHASVRAVWYFDTPDLALRARGIVFRLRDNREGADLTLKAAGQECATVPSALLPRAEGKCENDWHGTHVQGAVSLSRRLDSTDAMALREGPAALAAALSASQVRFLRERLGAWPLPPGIGALGPVTLQEYRPQQGAYTVEVWTVPPATTFVEISQKSADASAARVRDELLARLARANVEVCADQSSRADDKLEQLRR